MFDGELRTIRPRTESAPDRSKATAPSLTQGRDRAPETVQRGGDRKAAPSVQGELDLWFSLRKLVSIAIFTGIDERKMCRAKTGETTGGNAAPSGEIPLEMPDWSGF